MRILLIMSAFLTQHLIVMHSGGLAAKFKSTMLLSLFISPMPFFADSVMAGYHFWDGEKEILIDSVEFINKPHEMITMDVETTDVYFAHGVVAHNPIEEPPKEL